MPALIAEPWEWGFLGIALLGAALSAVNLRERLIDAAVLRRAGVDGTRHVVAAMSVESEWLRLLSQALFTVCGIGFLFSASSASVNLMVWVLRLALMIGVLTMAITSANAFRRHRQLRRLVASRFHRSVPRIP